jgi:hypothetical protein
MTTVKELLMPDVFEIVLLAICAALALCPLKYDPAIRLKEFNERWSRRLSGRE